MKQFHSAVQLGECCEVVVSRCLLSCCSAVVQHVLHCFAERTSLSDTALSGRPVCLSLSRHGRLFLIVRQMCLSLNRHVRLSLIVRQTCLSLTRHVRLSFISCQQICLSLTVRQMCLSICISLDMVICFSLSGRCVCLSIDMFVYLSLSGRRVCLSLTRHVRLSHVQLSVEDVCLSFSVRQTCLSISRQTYLSVFHYLSVEMFVCLSLSGRRVCLSLSLTISISHQTCSVFHCQVDVSVAQQTCLSVSHCQVDVSNLFVCLPLSGRCVCLSLTRHVHLSFMSSSQQTCLSLSLTVRQMCLSISQQTCMSVCHQTCSSVSHCQVDISVSLTRHVRLSPSGRHVCLALTRHVCLFLTVRTVRQTCLSICHQTCSSVSHCPLDMCLSLTRHVCLSLNVRQTCLSLSSHVHLSLTVRQMCLFVFQWPCSLVSHCLVDMSVSQQTTHCQCLVDMTVISHGLLFSVSNDNCMIWEFKCITAILIVTVPLCNTFSVERHFGCCEQ